MYQIWEPILFVQKAFRKKWVSKSYLNSKRNWKKKKKTIQPSVFLDPSHDSWFVWKKILEVAQTSYCNYMKICSSILPVYLIVPENLNCKDQENCSSLMPSEKDAQVVSEGITERNQSSLKQQQNPTTKQNKIPTNPTPETSIFSLIQSSTSALMWAQSTVSQRQTVDTHGRP